jgi:hypothetical protein
MRSKLTKEQWKELLNKQKEKDQTDQECSQETGINIACLRYWRKNLKTSAKKTSEELVEVSGLTNEISFPIRITLSNGIQIEVLQLSNFQAILSLSEGLNKL